MNMSPPWIFRLLKKFLSWSLVLASVTTVIQKAEAGQSLEPEFEAILSNTTKLPKL